MKGFQQGITTRPQGHLLLLALEFKATDPAGCNAAVETLRALIKDGLTSQLPAEDASTDKSQPSPETGELGFDDGYYRAHLTITVGFSIAAFQKTQTASDLIPADLTEVPWDLLDDDPAIKDPGDILLQICSDNVYINEHVSRRIETKLADAFAIAWTVTGVQRFTSTAGRTSRERGRALIGFLDGISNLDPAKSDDDARLVFVDPAEVAGYPAVPASGGSSPYGQPAGPTFPTDLRPPPTTEPAWTKGGTYMTVRASTIDVSMWDADTLDDQEVAVGRFKYSGASHDLVDDRSQTFDPPAFAADQTNQKVLPSAHIRKANPRGPGDADRRIFRRGYPMFVPTEAARERGLVFIAFARSISTQFEFILRAWMKNENFPTPGAGMDKLLRFEQVKVGGYYFVPSLSHTSEPWSWLWPAG